MAVKTPQDLFLYELSGTLDAERKIAQMLPILANAVTDGRLQEGIMAHERETQQHIRNVEQAIQRLGGSPMQVSCQAVDGMQQDFETFRQQRPPPELLTMFALGAAEKTEYFEVATYRGLVAKAEMMGNADIARLLRENLQQEMTMAQRVEQSALELGRQMLQHA
jgi:ferritin-like metal-binding protein YciE